MYAFPTAVGWRKTVLPTAHIGAVRVPSRCCKPATATRVVEELFSELHAVLAGIRGRSLSELALLVAWLSVSAG